MAAAKYLFCSPWPGTSFRLGGLVRFGLISERICSISSVRSASHQSAKHPVSAARFHADTHVAADALVSFPHQHEPRYEGQGRC